MFNDSTAGMMKICTSLLAVLACLRATNAHGDHGSHSDGPRPDDWALYHLEEEHHISNFDPPSFFTLHDFNNDGVWTSDEVRKMYGLDDVSLKDVAADTKSDAVQKVMGLFDLDGAGQISREAFIQRTKEGVKLPDFNLGPGHHGDMEYEYEIHHFEKFHGPDTTEEDLIHPEDIEHFRLHDEMEDEAERIALQQSASIVEANIPLKFRKQGA